MVLVVGFVVLGLAGMLPDRGAAHDTADLGPRVGQTAEGRARAGLRPEVRVTPESHNTNTMIAGSQQREQQERGPDDQGRAEDHPDEPADEPGAPEQREDPQEAREHGGRLDENHVVALQPRDLDVGHAVLRIDRTWSLGTVKPPKTWECRTVDLNLATLARLGQHRGLLAQETLAQGWGEAAWLFPSATNTPLDESNLTEVFHRILKAATLPHFRVYDLRHTFASLLLSAGAPLLYVSQQLGHRKPTTTLRYYRKWIPSGDQRWVELLAGNPVLLEPETGTNVAQGVVRAGAAEAGGRGSECRSGGGFGGPRREW